MNRLKENKTGKSLFLRGIKGFVIILLAGFILLTGLTFGDYREASLKEVSLSGIREVVMMDNEVEVSQSFKAKYPKLDQIYVYFANEHEGKNTGDIIFTIYDGKETEVAKASVAASDIVSKDFTEVPLQVTLQQGKKYRLVVTGEGLSAGSSPIIYREKKSFGGQNVKAAGITYGGKMEVRYHYPAETTAQMLLIMGGAALLMVLVLFDFKKLIRGKKTEIAMRVLEQVLFFGTPLIGFYIVERFTYNSIADIYPVAVAMNLLLYYGLYFLGYVISGSRKANVIGCLLLSYILGAANYFVLTFRGNPILPTDIASFTTAMNVAENYTYTLNASFFTSGLLMLFVTILYCKLKAGKKINARRRVAVLATGLSMVFCVAGFMKQEKFLNSYNVKADIWNQKRGYSRDGALASFCLNAKYLFAEKPDGYSVERVKEIAETYIWNEEKTASLNGMSSRKKTKKKASKKKPNIIMIMNEAFSDLEVINEIETNEDYMPFIHGLTKNTIKGNLSVSIFGSGTCNSEFEVLTGNSMAFLPSGSIGYTQFVKDAMPNLTQTLKAQGYTGNLALHPYLADGWNRESVYENFGFEDFLSQDDFENPEMVRKYISDKENFKKVIELYENNQEVNPDDPFFLFTVTMQNHGGFTKDYGNFVNEIEITDETMKDAEAEQYLSLIKKSDEAFQYLVNYFKDQDEPTMIVMYGDHQPSVHDEFYEKLYGKSLDDLTTEELQQRYKVPFIIWTNYDIEEKEVEALSANYLGSYVLDAAGLQMTPYQRYLLDLSKKLPVINSVGYLGDDGMYYKYGDKSEYTDYISNYKILQYNNVIDFENRYTSFFTTENLVD